MLAAYENHWIDGVNQGEGFLLGSLRGDLFTVIDNVRQVCGEVINSRKGISKKDLRDLTRAGQRCSNPDWPEKHELSPDERNTALHVCSRCNINGYCSIQYQHQYWPEHKVDCRKRGGCELKLTRS
mmetsp:Transcript_33696/g.60668  ORF Transcript_33696/g.60668 Transcript_33696/m.60668 type:complete len:126 (-) Transcript_33696:2537-2914(-)